MAWLASRRLGGGSGPGELWGQWQTRPPRTVAGCRTPWELVWYPLTTWRFPLPGAYLAEEARVFPGDVCVWGRLCLGGVVSDASKARNRLLVLNGSLGKCESHDVTTCSPPPTGPHCTWRMSIPSQSSPLNLADSIPRLSPLLYLKHLGL